MVTSITQRVGLMAAVVVGFVAYAVSAVQTYAQVTYSSQLATTTALFGAISGDLLQTAVVIIGLVMGIAVFIFLVFWGWKKLKSKGMRG